MGLVIVGVLGLPVIAQAFTSMTLKVGDLVVFDGGETSWAPLITFLIALAIEGVVGLACVAMYLAVQFILLHFASQDDD